MSAFDQMTDCLAEGFGGKKFLGPGSAGDDADGGTLKGFGGFGDEFGADVEGGLAVSFEVNELGKFVHSVKFGHVW